MKRRKRADRIDRMSAKIAGLSRRELPDRGVLPFE
jgi:hypothetical protein